MPKRDAWWTQIIHFWYTENTSLKRLIDWAWGASTDHISNESLRLTSIMISWFFVSTNRTLRDSASKSLISLLQNRIPILIKILDKFKSINDPYILERLYGIAYGITLRTNHKNDIEDLAYFVYNNIFESEEVYPHVLLRDYARGIIEYSLYQNPSLNIEIEKIRPPYNSSFPKSLPENGEIEKKYDVDHDHPEFHEKYYSSQNNILSSMMTNESRRHGLYGDFGRYVFHRAVGYWELDSQRLSNWAVKKIFEEYGYDVNKHGAFDSQRKKHTNNRHYLQEERIGKKYQWIAFYDILARLADNYPKYESYIMSEEKEEYNGPWNPFVRNFDPTILISQTNEEKFEKESTNWWFNTVYSNWNLQKRDWIHKIDDLPDPSNIIEKTDNNGNKWLNLEIYPEWAEPKQLGKERFAHSHKRLWYQIRSYLINEEDFKKVKAWGTEQNFMGGWMPESENFYEIFYREYYWSPAYKDIKNYNLENKFWSQIHDPESGELITNTICTTESYLWEAQYDASKEEAIKILMPSGKLYKDLDMEFSDREGEFVKNNTLICFDPSVNNKSPACCLIDKNEIIEYLEKNNLQIVWTVLGEKQILGREEDINPSTGRQEISGFYYFDNNQITGNLHSKIIE
jgi:hypothetical protein